ncbi:thioredoxin TrxC [Candidatus Magnetaquicoccus inordinatus]|uniref:thioredoxin TrxC n=1 Tax=Candidatus Magnetaquicoccus inordinatus TaxID=2496818 RepID=UPI00102C2F7F|nr:thioredoxin TrxC [Candidatus Magnetaquicoccus inordinatus]
MVQPRQIVCPTCSAVNRLQAEKPLLQGRCGRCKGGLFLREPLNLTMESFERHLENSEIPLLVDFWASWCGPCKMMAPILHQAAGKLEPLLRIAKVDTDAEQLLAAQYSIQSIPTLILFKQGQEYGRRSGAMTLSALLEWLQKSM